MQVWRALHRWSITEGLRRIDLDREDPPEIAPDASTTLQAIRDADQRGIYLLFDLHPYLGYASTQRQLRDLMQRRDCQPHVLVPVGHKVELPGELGRFDEIFFVDLPDAATREQLFALHLCKRSLGPEGFDVPALAAASDGFSVAEIEQAIVAALYAAHAAGAPLADFLLRAELKQTRPLSVLMAEQVAALREWARGRTVAAD